jgi:hypothetical protein
VAIWKEKKGAKIYVWVTEEIKSRPEESRDWKEKGRGSDANRLAADMH